MAVVGAMILTGLEVCKSQIDLMDIIFARYIKHCLMDHAPTNAISFVHLYSIRKDKIYCISW